MIHFTTNHCELKTTIPSLKHFVNDLYYQYYKKNNQNSNYDERYPNLKITDDIFSVSIWLRTRKGIEQRIFLDGDVFLNQLFIHTITIEGQKFDEDIHRIINKTLIELTKICKGFIYVETNFSPIRLENGKSILYKELVTELYEGLDEENKKHLSEVYNALYDGFSQQN